MALTSGMGGAAELDDEDGLATAMASTAAALGTGTIAPVAAAGTAKDDSALAQALSDKSTPMATKKVGHMLLSSIQMAC